MTLAEHIAACQELIKKDPKNANRKIVYCGDDEGNFFQYVNFSPISGYFNGSEFDNELPKSKHNTVCIN